MMLSELDGKFGIRLVKDGEFDSVGILSRPKEKMLVFIEDTKYIPSLNQKYVVCVIGLPEFSDSIPTNFGLAISDSPRKSFYEMHNYLIKKGFYGKLSENSISKDAIIHENSYLSKEGVHIGKNTIIEPNVTILPNTWIGDNVIIRAGSVVGGQGFVFPKVGEVIIPVEHAGGVRICDGVEIQTNCCVDKSIFGGCTLIEEDTKIDNMVHIAHDVKIGKKCRIAAGVNIAGCVLIGNDVWIGIGATISNELKIGDNAYISIGSVVVKDVLPEQKVTGNFAVDHSKFIAFLIKNKLG